MKSIKNFLSVLGFVPKEGFSGVWSKKYSQHKDYEISITLKDSLKDSTIEYGPNINVMRKTTSNFSQRENEVVLECVDRLLTKGYKPKSLVLEKQWSLGHKGKGFLDVQVLDENKKSFLMIECKTWGDEYNKALAKTERDGGQLFGYLQQEPETKYISLYASRFENGKIEFVNDIIERKEEFDGKNSEEMFEVWDRTFESKGIFESYVQPYRVEFKELVRADLKTVEQEDGGRIFNSFAEILRRNVVSDKNNAFNKILNLFLCKIVDEDDHEEEFDELDFQWKKKYDAENKREKNAGYKEFLGKLNDLYKKGVEDYLEVIITDHSKEEVEEWIQQIGGSNEKAKEHIKTIIEDLRFYKSNEFAFKEVHNEQTFEENAKIVKEIVSLLQKFQLKYTTKHQFLGDFFENLLNTGIKQESGQFFTPTPLASFICKSLPFWNIIEQKNEEKEETFLPHVIDYAAGSGHFLNEAMNEIDYYVKNKIDENWIKGGKRAKDEFFSGIRSYKWAKEYIYGIEKDYRLARTSKISTFMNGDGDANVICGDGLGHFGKDQDYKKILKTDGKSKDNQVFDVLVANPPYSVDEFKLTIEKHAKESFDLFEGLSDKAKEIECLFVERAKQLLKDGGVAGIVLPVSILSNGNLHMRAREILLKYFEIRGIVELGSGAFMATGTKTATLFLKRRKNNEWRIIQTNVEEFFESFRDVTVNGIENAFSTYTKTVYEDLSFEDYKTLFTENPSEGMQKHEIFKEYASHFKKLKGDKLIKAITETEKEKMLYFFLTYNQDVVLVKSPTDKDTEKDFLGYEFSTRRGHEGIKIYKDAENKTLTKLYNAEEGELCDEKKVNSYILRAFEGQSMPEVAEDLKEVAQVQKLHESIDFERVNFEKRITTEFSKKKVQIKSKWDFTSLRDIAIVRGGNTFKKKFQGNKNNDDIPFYKVSDTNIQENSKIMSISNNYVGKEILENEVKANIFEGNTIIFPKVGMAVHTNKKRILSRPASIDNNLMGITVINDKKILPQYLLEYFIKYIHLSDIASSANPPSINAQTVYNLKIPFPPLDVQEKIVREMEAIEKREKEISEAVEQGERNIEEVVKNISAPSQKLDSITEFIQRGKSPKYGESSLQIIKSGQARGMIEFDFSKRHFASEAYILDHRKLQRGDVLINSSGVGTAGRVTLFDLGGDFVTDSHISILRIIGEKANSNFVLHCLAGIGFKNIEAMATGQSGQIELAIDTIKNIKIPLPPLPEQEKIITQIEAIETKQATLKKELEELKAKKGEVLKNYL